MRIEAYETKSRTFPIYRISFQETRIRKILKQFAEDHHALKPEASSDHSIIEKFLFSNKKQLAKEWEENSDFSKEESLERIEEIRTTIKRSGDEALDRLREAERLEKKAKRYDRSDDSKRERAEEIKQGLQEWERSVEEGFKGILETLGFLESHEVEGSEFDETTLGASRGNPGKPVEEEEEA